MRELSLDSRLDARAGGGALPVLTPARRASGKNFRISSQHFLTSALGFPQDPTSSARRVLEKLQELDLAGLCRVIEGDLRDSRDEVLAALGVIDLAWIDTWDTLAFVREYWQSIDPAGGLAAELRRALEHGPRARAPSAMSW